MGSEMCIRDRELRTHKSKPAVRGLFYCLDCTPIISHTGLLYEENDMGDEYIKALEHWARCFREGVISDQFADEIAYLLEDKAHDLKMDQDTISIHEE